MKPCPPHPPHDRDTAALVGSLIVAAIMLGLLMLATSQS